MAGVVGALALLEEREILLVSLPPLLHQRRNLRQVFLQRAGSRRVRTFNFDILDVPKEVDDGPQSTRLFTAREEVPSHTRLRVDLGLVVGIEEVAQRQLRVGSGHLRFQELEDVVGPAVDDSDSDVVVRVVRVGRLVEGAGARRNDVGRVKVGVHGVCLAGVDHEQQLMVALLLPHLAERIRQIPRPDLFGVLELQELVPAVARHVDEHVAAGVGAQALAARDVIAQPIRKQPDEVLHRHLVTAIVHLDVIAVEIDRAVCVAVDGAGEGVARVAGHVVGQHQNDLRVGDPESLDGAVQRQDIGKVAVVKPEPRRRDQHSPVGCVLSKHRGCKQQEEGEESRSEDGEETHGGQTVRSWNGGLTGENSSKYGHEQCK